MENLEINIEKLEETITENLRDIKSLQNEVRKKEYEKHDQFKEIISGIIEVIDTFEMAESVIEEKNYLSEKNAISVNKRYQTVKKRLLRLLSNYGVTKLEFPENKLIYGYCKVLDTEPDPNLPNDTIIEIEKNGYIKGSLLIRDAEVIIVKN